ncbi:MAG: hypothetical protein A2283_12200 [Lentisphaerae bacterium RIFOXYA12_FULL_48_11]|nr:MAG: hypothetical protein A2283_12200 [Lentisphaerae bacterium RIFOXYA12_FULL_48_11]
MKGIINKGIQELVETKFGVEAWLKIKELANCEEPFFAASENYPDEMTIALVKAAAEVSGLSPEEVQVEFGKYWVPNTGRKAYPTFFQIAGTTPREFLINMNRVHDIATRTAVGAAPPKFSYEELPDGKLIMRYHSKRKLCSVLRGLIMGVGILYQKELEVVEKCCMFQGADYCEMEISFDA